MKDWEKGIESYQRVWNGALKKFEGIGKCVKISGQNVELNLS